MQKNQNDNTEEKNTKGSETILNKRQQNSQNQNLR